MPRLRSIWYNNDFSIICLNAKSRSLQPLLFLNPHCSSLSTKSIDSLHLFNVTEANTSSGTDSRDQLLHSVLFPLLLYRGTIYAILQSLGMFCFSWLVYYVPEHLYNAAMSFNHFSWDVIWSTSFPILQDSYSSLEFVQTNGTKINLKVSSGLANW